jgi:transcriptional regulator with XRE-family HTH domain
MRLVAEPEDARSVFAQNLRRERLRVGLSQEELGFESDLDTSEISKLERATRDPRLATIVRVARALEIRPARLLDGIP